MDASVPAAQQDAPPEVTAPLRAAAAAAAMHPLPPSSSRATFQSTSGMQHPSQVCSNVPEDRTWTEGPRHCPLPGHYIPANLIVEHESHRKGYARSNEIVCSTCDNHALTECARLCDNTEISSWSHWRVENRTTLRTLWFTSPTSRSCSSS